MGKVISKDEVVAAFIATRNELAAEEKAFKESIAERKELQKKREAWLLGELTKQDVESMRAKSGTFFVDWKDSVTIADPVAFMDWVFADTEHRRNFLENRCSKSAVKQRLEDEEPLPPGVNYTKVKAVKVRQK